MLKIQIFNERFALKFFGFLFLLLIALVLIVPFVYLIVSSLKDMKQFYATNLQEVWFPWPLHFDNYIKAVTMVELPRYIINSIVLGAVQTFCCVFSSALVAYGFSRFKFPGRHALFIVVLATMMLPSQVTNIPLFILYKNIKWTNTFLPLIVPYLCGSAWHIFLIRQFMMDIPLELEDAALIDGCTSWQMFYKIILKQSIPALVISALFQFLFSWKDLLGPLIYISNNKLYPLTVGLLFFESPTEVNYTVQLAAVTIALIPTIIMFVFGRNHFEKGINIAEFK